MAEITQIKAIDAPLLDELGRVVGELVYGATIEPEQLRRMVEAPNIALFAARKEGRLVGITTVAWYDTLTARRGWVEDVVVCQEMRGAGIGRQLVRQAIAWAKKQGIETLSLTSAPHRKAARQLYAEEGFESIDTGLFRLKPQEK